MTSTLPLATTVALVSLLVTVVLAQDDAHFSLGGLSLQDIRSSLDAFHSDTTEQLTVTRSKLADAASGSASGSGSGSGSAAASGSGAASGSASSSGGGSGSAAASGSGANSAPTGSGSGSGSASGSGSGSAIAAPTGPPATVLPDRATPAAKDMATEQVKGKQASLSLTLGKDPAFWVPAMLAELLTAIVNHLEEYEIHVDPAMFSLEVASPVVPVPVSSASSSAASSASGSASGSGSAAASGSATASSSGSGSGGSSASGSASGSGSGATAASGSGSASASGSAGGSASGSGSAVAAKSVVATQVLFSTFGTSGLQDIPKLQAAVNRAASKAGACKTDMCSASELQAYVQSKPQAIQKAFKDGGTNAVLKSLAAEVDAAKAKRPETVIVVTGPAPAIDKLEDDFIKGSLSSLVDVPIVAASEIQQSTAPAASVPIVLALASALVALVF